MSLDYDKAVEKILEIDLQLGPSSIKLPKMIILEKIGDLNHRIKDLSLNDQTDLKLIPKSNKKTKIVYPNWKK